MAIIPDFLIKRVYKKGSLKETQDGITFELKNVIGPGIISGLSSIQINDQVFTKETIKFKTQNAVLSALTVSEESPIHFRLGQEGTVFLEKAKCLRDGLNQIIIELTNPQAGTIKVTLSDEIRLT
jgi:hypothetical protein